MASHGVPRSVGVVDKSAAAKEREQKQIAEYRELEKTVQDKVTVKDFSSTTFFSTTALLKQNPEYYTIWNYRRLILNDTVTKEFARSSPEDGSSELVEAEKAGMTVSQREVSLLIKEDLQFLVPLLRQFPKCYWIWNHRSWLLSTATTHLPTSVAVSLWQGELALVTKMLGLDSRNFHGWDYRRKTVAELERLTNESMVQVEFDYTTKMIKSNLSNFSAWHNRSQLIPRLLKEQQADDASRKSLFDAEIELITTALYTDSYDQSLWFYHQYLMSTLDTDAPTNNDEYGRDTAILERPSHAERSTYLEQEIESVRDMLDGAEDCKYIYQALLEYAERLNKLEPGKISTEDIKAWLDELQKLDPLRSGRWHDLRMRLML